MTAIHPFAVPLVVREVALWLGSEDVVRLAAVSRCCHGAVAPVLASRHAAEYSAHIRDHLHGVVSLWWDFIGGVTVPPPMCDSACYYRYPITVPWTRTLGELVCDHGHVYRGCMFETSLFSGAPTYVWRVEVGCSGTPRQTELTLHVCDHFVVEARRVNGRAHVFLSTLCPRPLTFHESVMWDTLVSYFKGDGTATTA